MYGLNIVSPNVRKTEVEILPCYDVGQVSRSERDLAASKIRNREPTYTHESLVIALVVV